MSRNHPSILILFIQLITISLFSAAAASAQDSLWTNQYTGRIDAETMITVRTNEDINADNSDGRVFLAYVAKDVRDSEGIITVPKGSAVELLVRKAASGELVLDLKSITIYGIPYSIETGEDLPRGAEKERTGANFRYAGASPLIGAIIGGAPGGRKGRPSRGAAGTDQRAQMWTEGPTVHIPSDSLVVIRLNEPLREPRIDRYYKRNVAR
jgi:hypothetical protein